MSDAANNLNTDAPPDDAETATPRPASPSEEVSVDEDAQRDSAEERAREGGYD